ncbi:MAG: hypothetical protein J0H98_10645 [Solirubrobacterales bacterium]|nr:hypothetical protein [Solirubrobacterales bacterium]
MTRRSRDHGSGRKAIWIRCPFCAVEVKAFVWSLSGSGKRCECGALFGARGKATKEQNPEARS